MIGFAIDTAGATLKLSALYAKARIAAKDAVVRGTAKLWDAVRSRVAANGSGRLHASIQQSVTDEGGGATGQVFSDGSAPYARIEEFGGRIAVPETRPVKAKALAFHYEGKLVFAKRAKAHEATIPAKPYLHPSLADIAPDFQADIEAAAKMIVS